MNDTSMPKTEEEWKQKLTPEEYYILRQKGTEAPFTGEYYDKHDAGMYQCRACGKALFSSEHKFDSGSGWPSFDAPMERGVIDTVSDQSGGAHRTEVLCSRCKSHLGHVFDDGPRNTTGKRFCVNSKSLRFESSGES